MSSRRFSPPSYFLAALVGLLSLVPGVRAGLEEYVNRPEPAFSWKLRDKKETEQGTIDDLHLVSQTWQNITWKHQLQVYRPKGVEPNAKMMLWNTGGTANDRNIALGMELARKARVPCAFLYGVPNQPLLGDKKEDGLIALSFVLYLNTRDENWPLLFPMVKSVVKAMDALQAFSKQEWKRPVEKFIVAGGSKRGWTSWLTAAADDRVAAIAPCVIDTLNMPVQMPHQLKSFGKYSVMIQDYTNTGLVPMPTTPEAKRLWSMVDPYAYRDKLKMPKFIVNGNNDPYWATDALNLYWDDLKGDKWVLYVPNAGHNLEQRLKGGAKDRSRAVNGIAAFARHQVTGKTMPHLEWRHTTDGDKLRLSVEPSVAPLAARLWVATSDNRDFRDARWQEKPAATEKVIATPANGDGAAVAKDRIIGEVAAPKEGCLAFFAELDYEIDGIRYQLSTQLRLAGKPLDK
jgi:PhoPQ-activated pathogenicity-related protein